MHLGAIILGPLVAAFILRLVLLQPFLLAGTTPTKPKWHFFWDFGLILAAGLVTVTFAEFRYGMPRETSIKMVVAYSSFGFFIALDLMLADQRRHIAEAPSGEAVLAVRGPLFPLGRKLAAFSTAAAAFFVVVLSLLILSDQYWLRSLVTGQFDPSKALMSVVYEVMFVMAILLAMVLNIIFSYTRNLTMLFNNQTRVLERVSGGDLSGNVPVVTTDEFGIIAAHTNMMIKGLRHRAKLLSALKVAEEVQHNLLPKAPPVIDGLDISAGSRYSNQVGGDYYDFIDLPGGHLGVLVADAAGHGVGAALFMSTARALLRTAITDYQGPGHLLDHVNRFLAADSGDSGRFVSMFFLDIDTTNRVLRWVRAGHEPAMLFNAEEGLFRSLAGDGVALGVIERAPFTEYRLEGWMPGSLILIGTDGIRETTDPDGSMFGLDRIKRVVRDHAGKSAEAVREAILAQLQAFRGEAPQDDDITMVVIKLL